MGGWGTPSTGILDPCAVYIIQSDGMPSRPIVLLPIPPHPLYQGGAMRISALVQQLQMTEVDTAHEAAEAIVDLAANDNDPETRANIVAAGALPPLVALLGAQCTAV